MFALLGEMLSEAVATRVSETHGIAPMVRGVGVVQVVLALFLLLCGVARFGATG